MGIQVRDDGDVAGRWQAGGREDGFDIWSRVGRSTRLHISGDEE